MGLLAMVHGIIHQYDGHIIVDSTLGEGTTFRLLLPVMSKESQGLKSPQQEITSIDIKPHTDKKHIMLVDDEISICHLFAEFLIDNGYEASTFIDSEEALRAFEKAPDKYDCLITDQTMPKLTGIELASKIAHIRKDFPIIMQTGYSDQINEQTIEGSVISVLLKKPVDIHEMISTVNNIFNKDSGVS
jgi:CheY-like chemotaxis protein